MVQRPSICASHLEMRRLQRGRQHDDAWVLVRGLNNDG